MEADEVSEMTATTTSRDLATITTVVDWQTALEIIPEHAKQPSDEAGLRAGYGVG